MGRRLRQGIGRGAWRDAGERPRRIRRVRKDRTGRTARGGRQRSRQWIVAAARAYGRPGTRTHGRGRGGRRPRVRGCLCRSTRGFGCISGRGQRSVGAVVCGAKTKTRARTPGIAAGCATKRREGGENACGESSRLELLRSAGARVCGRAPSGSAFVTKPLTDERPGRTAAGFPQMPAQVHAEPHASEG